MQLLARLLLVVSVLLPAACSREPQPAVEAASVAGFERSAFLRRHPPLAREQRDGALIYRFEDRYGESRQISVSLAPATGELVAVTVDWRGDSNARWSSIKKQFVADLLESTFSEVDYGSLSAYAMRLAEGSDPDRAAPWSDASGTQARFHSAGPELTLILERRAHARLQPGIR